MSIVAFTSQERRIVSVLASIFSLRMLGLFMIMPVFVLSSGEFSEASEKLVGFAIGVYGLSQAILQIPFGFLSDKFGRKHIMLIGLLLLAIGSFMAALAESIYGVILGRAMQGAGAIGCVIMATVADYTREQVRTRSMALIGMTIGLSFMIAMSLGPFLHKTLGLRSIFWLTGVLALIGIPVLCLAIPKSANFKTTSSMPFFWQEIRLLLVNMKLLNLILGIFSLHAVLSAIFLVVPVLIRQVGFTDEMLWKFYLPILISAFIVALICIMRAEKRSSVGKLHTFAILGLFLAENLLAITKINCYGIILSLFGFFVSFCILEASLPSLVSKCVPAKSKGTALGIYSSGQFLGIFFGGIIGGWLHGSLGITAVLIFCMVLSVNWLVFSSLVQFKSVKKREESYG